MGMNKTVVHEPLLNQSNSGKYIGVLMLAHHGFPEAQTAIITLLLLSLKIAV